MGGGDRWRRIVRRRLAKGFEPDSLRGRLLIATGLALAPVVVFASAMALHQAQVTRDFAGTAAWLTAAALPVLLGVAAVLAIAIASETLILRWLLYFERVARAYGRGRYSVRPRDLERAPSEFRALGSAVQEMAVAVEERDAALRKALGEQTMLLREVHHRVKNNLQIIGSLLSLQANRADDQKVKDALMDALVRIDAMSLAQRFMQEDEEAGAISSGQLFHAWASQLRARLGSCGRGLRLRLEVQERQLSLDLAAPMALIATEALMQAYRRPGAMPLSCRLKVAMHDGEDVTLSISVEEDIHAFDTAGGIGLTLIEGYVRQIRGRLDLPVDAGRLIVHAPIPAAA